jgi:hypothetical protein
MGEYLNPNCVALLSRSDRKLVLHLTSGRVLTITNANEQIEEFMDKIIGSSQEGAGLIQIPEMVSFNTVPADEFVDYPVGSGA